MIPEYFSKMSKNMKYLLAAGALIVILILLFFYGAKAWSGIGNYFFHREIAAAKVEVQSQLDKAAEQKKELEKTLLELDQAKKDLAVASHAREEAEKVLNDKSKTAQEKVAAYKATLADAPIRTDTTGITTSDLCQRAKDQGASEAVVSALCGR